MLVSWQSIFLKNGLTLTSHPLWKITCGNWWSPSSVSVLCWSLTNHWPVRRWTSVNVRRSGRPASSPTFWSSQFSFLELNPKLVSEELCFLFAIFSPCVSRCWSRKKNPTLCRQAECGECELLQQRHPVECSVARNNWLLTKHHKNVFIFVNESFVFQINNEFWTTYTF